ncbi:MAG: FAD-dependent oxidoreductase [Candidatus Thermoplasmatota archaeon]|nr:FAD-dependent oxidoreductase [Candidatus Thermoplasmatota archaeon]MCL5963824.1 FAD-dependent oxidoreductase [Candidatus Thermoplasmatota archaeon]
METDVLVIGAGATGIFTALDLSLRGVKVMVIDKNTIASGTSGHYHGLIHSGARYAMTDPDSAVECSRESEVLFNMAPFAMNDTGGIFIATDDDEKYINRFMDSLEKLNINHREIPLQDIVKMEPEINHNIKSAVYVKDRVADPFVLLGGAAMLAHEHGCKFILNKNVSAINENIVKANNVDIKCKYIINATGPYADKIAKLAKIDIKDVMPTLGIMIVYNKIFINHVINRMRLPSDGDIFLPFWNVSILGTTAKLTEDLDNIVIEEEDIKDLIEEGSAIIPDLQNKNYSRYYYSSRPLIRDKDTRKSTRGYTIIDNDPVITIIGGKFTTARLIGEKIADYVTEKMDVDRQSITTSQLLPDPYSLVSNDSISSEKLIHGLAVSELEKRLLL